MFNFWIAFFTWYVWVTGISFYVIKAIPRLRQEDEAEVPGRAPNLVTAASYQ
jgi:hypothetical protein